MTMTKRLIQTAGLGAGVIAAIAASAPDSELGRAARRLAERLAKDVRYAVASAPGILYRLSGRRPDPDVTDDVLADRIRSAIGPLEKKLDIPHVHVMVEDHVAVIHGDVPDDWTACALDAAILRVSGVEGVVSHLHAGLINGDTRPSQGAAVPAPPSDALRQLLDAARTAGAGSDARAAVHAVLCGFSDRIPEDERVQMFAHLPADARALAGPAHRHGTPPPRLKTLPQLVAAVVAEGGIDAARAEAITRSVVAKLHELVPEEAADVAAVLPSELRELWESATAS